MIDFLGGLFGDLISDFVLGALEPQLQTLIAELLPDPLGIENTLDLGGFLTTLSPGTTGALEARVVPGGYAFVEGGGLSVGIISGINTDRDPSTRTPDLDSEPAVCVPPMAAPDLAALGLPQSPRGNFVLPAAGAFRGQPEDPNSDVAIGVSQTFLDMAGHHIITSGALCLGIGTQTIPQLNLGTIGIVVPSLGELGEAEGTTRCCWSRGRPARSTSPSATAPRSLRRSRSTCRASRSTSTRSCSSATRAASPSASTSTWASTSSSPPTRRATRSWCRSWSASTPRTSASTCRTRSSCARAAPSWRACCRRCSSWPCRS